MSSTGQHVLHKECMLDYTVQMCALYIHQKCACANVHACARCEQKQKKPSGLGVKLHFIVIAES